MAKKSRSYSNNSFSNVPEKNTKNNKVGLDSLLSADCSLVTKSTCNKDEDPGKYVDQIIENLPGAKYVASTFTQLAYSNGLISEDDKEDAKLQEFLGQVTPSGITNRDVIYQAMMDSVIYGGSLVRFVTKDSATNPLINADNDFLAVHSPSNFNPVVVSDKNILVDTIVGYEVTESDSLAQKEKQADQQLGNDKIARLISDPSKPVKTDNGILVSADYAMYPRFYPGYITVESPFYYDRLRIDLALASLDRNIADLRKDGIGRLILYERQTVQPETITEEAFAGNAAEGSKQGNTKREEDVRNIRNLSSQIKNSGTDSVIVLDNDRFMDKVDSIPRQVTSSNYLSVIEDSVKISCNAYGLPPGMFGVRDSGYQTGVKPLLDFAEANYISPFRNRFADNLNQFLKEKLGLKSDIKFDMLDTTDAEELAKSHQSFISVARDMVNIGVPLGEVNKYLNANIDLDLDEKEKTRLLATNLTNADVEIK